MGHDLVAGLRVAFFVKPTMHVLARQAFYFNCHQFHWPCKFSYFDEMKTVSCRDEASFLIERVANFASCTGSVADCSFNFFDFISFRFYVDMWARFQLRQLLPPLPDAAATSSAGAELLKATSRYAALHGGPMKVQTLGQVITSSEDSGGNFIQETYAALWSWFDSTQHTATSEHVNVSHNNATGDEFLEAFCNSSGHEFANAPKVRPVVFPKLGWHWPVVAELRREEPKRIRKKDRATAYRYNTSFSTPLRFTLRHLLRAAYEATVGTKAEEASLGFSDWWFNSPEYVIACWRNAPKYFAGRTLWPQIQEIDFLS